MFIRTEPAASESTRTPIPACQKPTGGHPEAHPRREIVDGIRYLVDNGMKWPSKPADYPPWRTIYGFARRWAAAGVIGVIRNQLRRQVRLASRLTEHQGVRDGRQGHQRMGRSQKDQWAERHLICDNRGLVLLVMVTAANVTDRDAAKELLFRLALTHPEIDIVWADSAYAGKLVTWAKTYLDITTKTVKRPPDAKGFVVLPRRWVVERSWSWIMRARRHCRDHERLPEMSESLITWAAVTLMTRRLTRRTTRPAEPRDVSPYYLAQAA